MTRPVHRFPGNRAGRLLLVLFLLCSQGWTWTLWGQDGSAETYRTESKLRVPAGTEIRVRMKEPLTTRTHKVGDTFSARVLQNIAAGAGTAIPTGVEVRGSISQLVRAGRIRGRARMNLHFKELRFRDGRVVPVDARMASLVEPRKKSVPEEEGTLVGPGEKGRDAGKVGTSSAIGALIGMIGGGKEGVAVGAATDAAVGAAGVLVTRGRDIVIPAGTEIVIRLNKDLDIPASRRTPPPRREEPFSAHGDAL